VKNNINEDFIKLYDPIHTKFYGFCRAISGNIDDAEDLLQDSILNVIEGFQDIRDKSSFKSYLYSVARNLHKMKLRRYKFKAEFNEDEIKGIFDSANDQISLVDFKIIYEKILSLPEKISETLILFYISDLSIEEINKIQGGSLSGVKQRLKRGREKLIKQLNTPDQIRMALIFLTL
jgi:RNA polymerase sigma-70 factor, ECF subfamily